MPFRAEITALNAYEVGRPIDEVARDLGLDPQTIIKLAANESPEGPFPGVIEAATKVLASSNRYPDNEVWELGHALGAELGVDKGNLLFGNGSVALIADIANAVGDPGTNMVYGWPSFIMYRFASVWARMRHIEVPLNSEFALDLPAMRSAIDTNTRMVVVCNPNNPTGTITPADEIESFIDDVPESVMVVVDEAYHEFVSDSGYRTAIGLAVNRPNVLVLRTFSKIYSLASMRIGYAVGSEATLRSVKKAQQPLTVSQVAQAAALASLGQPDEMARRVTTNAAARHHLMGALAERSIPYVESQTNFIYFHPSDDSRGAVKELTHRGVIIRPMTDGWVRVTIGSEEENERFLNVLDEVVSP